MKKKKLALRLAQILVVLVGISFVTFLLTYLSPGDPVRNMYTAAGIMRSSARMLLLTPPSSTNVSMPIAFASSANAPAVRSEERTAGNECLTSQIWRPTLFKTITLQITILHCYNQ